MFVFAAKTLRARAAAAVAAAAVTFAARGGRQALCKMDAPAIVRPRRVR